MVEELVKQTAPDNVISKWTAAPVDKAAVNTFEIDVTFTSSHLVEKAGPAILLKVGELIGPQSELYRDSERMNDIENDFNRGYERSIKVSIPTGYSIRNLDDLKFDVVYQEGDQQPFVFQSTYVVDKNVLTVHLVEYYKNIRAPKSRYEDFRKVINAAADFNKVVLVLEKQK
jgi:hypothetical protein